MLYPARAGWAEGLQDAAGWRSVPSRLGGEGECPYAHFRRECTSMWYIRGGMCTHIARVCTRVSSHVRVYWSAHSGYIGGYGQVVYMYPRERAYPGHGHSWAGLPSISGRRPNPQTLSRVSTVVFSHRPGRGRGCQGRPSSLPQPRSQDSLHLVYIQPWALEVEEGGPLGPKASCPSQALRAQGTGGGAGCTALCWGRKREWGGGRPQPVEARQGGCRVQDVWGGREVPHSSPEALLAPGRRPSSSPQEWTSWIPTSLTGTPGITMTCCSGWVAAPMEKSSRLETR